MSGRREMNLHELRMQEIEDQATWNPLKRYVLTLELMLIKIGFISGSARRCKFFLLYLYCNLIFVLRAFMYESKLLF